MRVSDMYLVITKSEFVGIGQRIHPERIHRERIKPIELIRLAEVSGSFATSFVHLDP